HVPFPKMVKKAFLALFEPAEADKAEALFQQKVEPTLEWNRQCGNAYTASLWIAVASMLHRFSAGKRLLAFSYGSGCGGELLTLKIGPEAQKGEWTEDVRQDFSTRTLIQAEEYESLRREE